ncbi:MAG: SDR family oxidoreductase, partial [Acidimicrobiales bacterium]
GAASGIGASVAAVLAAAGADVVLADRDSKGLAGTAENIAQFDRQAVSSIVDVRSRDEVEELGRLVVAQFGRLDVWVNVAGILRRSAIVDTSQSDLDDILDVNLKGTYWGCATAARIMMPAGRGSIINFASAGGEMPAPELSVYSLTKAAVIMLTRTLAVEAGPSGVRANAVSPGFTDTPMVSGPFARADGSIDEAQRDEVYARRAEQAALRMIAEPMDIALTVQYLASDASRFVTGQNLRVNGGVHMA